MPRIPARGRHITQEPQIIAEHLLGHSLATFRRRMGAYVIDVTLFGLLIGALFVGLTAWSFHREDPTLFSRAQKAFQGSGAEGGQLAKDQVVADYYYLILERCPDAFPRPLATMVRSRDMVGLREYFKTANTTVGLGNGKTRTIENSDGTTQMIIGLDLLMGRFSSALGWGGLFVGWFTFWSLVTGGRSPGKLLLRIRVQRLDGQKLRLWDSFSRSAGYSASAATLMLGFLEAIWHPNRQAIHDKIAGTVVVRI